MSTERGQICPKCGEEIPEGVPLDLCPACLVLACFGTGEGDPLAGISALQGGWIGDYELLEQIGEGGMGVVYKARKRGTDHHVALKMLPSPLASPADVYLFRAEVNAVKRLDHPNIVPIYEVGEHLGRPYFTMKWMAGGTLAAHLEQIRKDPRAAAAIVESLARAVHHAHQRGILHRDLKPLNILLDEKGTPYVADFGIAKDEQDLLTRRDGVPGTLAYMAPEHLDGHTTARSDVYGLGVILYELLTGLQPFRGRTAGEIQRQIRESSPRNPRAIAPHVERDLSVIVMRTLEKDPELRYGSAEELAKELRRYLNDEPIDMVGPARQAWRWCLRHSVASGAVVAAASFLLMMTFGAVSIARSLEASKRAQIQDGNRVIAWLVAGSVLSYLRNLGEDVRGAAESDEVVQALDPAAPDKDHPVDVCAHLHQRHAAQSPHSWFLAYQDGSVRCFFSPRAQARSGHSPWPEFDFTDKKYDFRDYFIGVRGLAEKGLRRAYVSHAFLAEADNFYQSTIAAPVYARDGKWLGLVVAAIATTATLGNLPPEDKQHTFVLAAPRGRDRDTPSLPDPPEYLVLRHPAYANYREAITLDDDQVRRLGRDSQEGDKHLEHWWELADSRWMTTTEGYEDPMGKKDPQYAGRRMAGLAPVGHTGFVVIVESSTSDTLGHEKELAGKVGRWVAIAAGPGVFLVVFAALHDYHRRRARRARTR
jgi:serine/threonine-protein kinase